MPKFNGNVEQKNAIFNISNDDFESPVVFKKFKSSHNNTQAKRIKHKKNNGKKQLTLHQVYDENFKHSDMNAEHLQLALALSRSTSEIINDHSIKEEFPLLSQKEGKKMTLLEFGFKTNKPKMNVDIKISRREPSKTNKKSKFRFVSPILMMRTEEDRDSLIQSKLSTIFGQNSIHSLHYEKSIPIVISEELNKIRCQDCFLFCLNKKGDTSKEQEYIVPQLNIKEIRARSGVLLKDWKQIALRDHTPSRSKEEISHLIEETNILDSKIENSTVCSKLIIAGNNLERDKSSSNESNISNNKIDLNIGNLEYNNSPSNSEYSVGYKYTAISPDLFDNDISLLNTATQVKKNLNSIFSVEEITHVNNIANSNSSNTSPSNDKYFTSIKCEMNSKIMLTQEKDNNSILKNAESATNEYENTNCTDSSDECTIIETKPNCSTISDKIKRKLENIENSFQESIFNMDENGEHVLSHSKEELKKPSRSNRSLLVSKEDIGIISSDEEFPISEIRPLKPFTKSEKCQGSFTAIPPLLQSCNKSDRTPIEHNIHFRSNEHINIDFCEEFVSPHSNENMFNVFCASPEDHTSAKEFSCSENIQYGSKLSESLFPGSYKEVKVLSIKTDDMNETNGENSDEIILSSDDEYSSETKSNNLSDILELRKLRQNYSCDLHNSSVDNSCQNHFNDNKSNLSKDHTPSKRKLYDSFNYLDENTENPKEKSSSTSNNSLGNNESGNGITFNSYDDCCSSEIYQKSSEDSPDKLNVEKPNRKFSDKYFSAVHPTEISLSIRSNLSGNHESDKKTSDSFGKLQLENKNFINDYEIALSSRNSDEKRVDVTNSGIHLPVDYKKSQEYFSDTMSGSILDDVFEKHSTCMEKNSYGSEELKGSDIPPTESNESYDSFESDVGEIKYFWNNEAVSNLNICNKQKLRDISKSSSSIESFNCDVHSTKIEEVNQFSSQLIERDYFDMNSGNMENISKLHLENTPNQKLRKTSNTPLRRYTSFDENCQTSQKKLNLTRHKSESNITPDRKFIIKSENITPMLDYNTFSTPDIVQELDKFGLKPLKRKRGINLLQHIYETTHPVLEAGQRGVDEIPIVKRRKSVVENTDILVDGFNEKKAWSGTILERDAIFERHRSSKKISTCQIPLQIVWHNFVNENPEILQNILLYEPLQVEVIHTMLKELGYKFHVQDLIAFLDQKCITIRVAQGHQDKGG